MTQYDPDELHLTKKEILDYLSLLIVRWQNNPKVHRLFITKLKLDLKLIKSFVHDEDLPYFWQLFRELYGGLLEQNSRKNNPELSKLNPMKQDAFVKSIVLAPEVVSELDAHTILAKAKMMLRPGAMRD